MKRKPFYSPAFVERMIAGEKAHIALTTYLNYTNTNPKGNNMYKAIIKVSYQGFPCEIHTDITNESNPATVIIAALDELKTHGFTAPVSYNKSGDDVLGMKGTVDSVHKGDMTAKGLQMYIVKGILENGKEFSWNEFTPTTFRPGDAFKVVKNDRGFKVGEIILPDLRNDNIPF